MKNKLTDIISWILAGLAAIIIALLTPVYILGYLINLTNKEKTNEQ